MANNQQYDNTNQGAIFINKRKVSAKHADYTGTLNVEGVEYWANIWVKKAKASGEQFLSVSLRKKEPRQADPLAVQKNNDPSDEIPF